MERCALPSIPLFYARSGYVYNVGAGLNRVGYSGAIWGRFVQNDGRPPYLDFADASLSSTLLLWRGMGFVVRGEKRNRDPVH